MKLKIKKGATVQVITGDDKGKKGEVLEVKPEKLLIKIKGIRIQTHFDKKEGILKKEGYIHYSNVKLLEAPAEKTKKPTKKKISTAKSA